MFPGEEESLVKAIRLPGNIGSLWTRKLFIRSFLFCTVLSVASFTLSPNLQLSLLLNGKKEAPLYLGANNSSGLDGSLSESSVDFFYDFATIVGGGLVDTNIDIARDILELASEYILRDARREREEEGSKIPPEIKIDCGHSDFSFALTGNLTSERKYIIDVVPFGFDVDYLEIRLLELYDIVDKFVIIEHDATHKGVEKPYFLLSKILKMDRFAGFKDKIEYIPFHIPEDIKRDMPEDIKKHDWRIEGLMRSPPIEYLRETFVNTSEELTHSVYVIQNDGDEIMSRRALANFKHCQHYEKYPIYAPSTLFKRNTAWTLELDDLRTLKISNASALGRFRNLLWRGGPTIWRWSDVDKAGSTKRGGVGPRTVHLGLGAANHFSSPSNPILQLLKAQSVVEAAPMKFSDGFWTNIRNRSLTVPAIEEEFLNCAVTEKAKFRWMLLEETGEVVSKFAIDHLPWAVTQPPYRYAWLYNPSLPMKEKHLFEKVCRNGSMN